MTDIGILGADKIESIVERVKSGEIRQFAYAYVGEGVHPCFSTQLVSDVEPADQVANAVMVKALFKAMESVAMGIARHNDIEREKLKSALR